MLPFSPGGPTRPGRPGAPFSPFSPASPITESNGTQNENNTLSLMVKITTDPNSSILLTLQKWPAHDISSPIQVLCLKAQEGLNGWWMHTSQSGGHPAVNQTLLQLT